MGLMSTLTLQTDGKRGRTRARRRKAAWRARPGGYMSDSHLSRPLEVAAVRRAEGHVREGVSRQPCLLDASRVQRRVQVALYDALPVVLRFAVSDDVHPRYDGRAGCRGFRRVAGRAGVRAGCGGVYGHRWRRLGYAGDAGLRDVLRWLQHTSRVYESRLCYLGEHGPKVRNAVRAGKACLECDRVESSRADEGVSVSEKEIPAQNGTSGSVVCDS